MSASQQTLDYLENQPGIVFKRLYKQPSTALAVFRRMLPHLAKMVVMAMLYMPDPLPDPELTALFRADARAEKDTAVSVLERLHILQTVPEPASPKAYRLAGNFQQSLRHALTGGGSHRSFGVPDDGPGANNVNVTYLDEYAREQWEGILYYMVGSTGSGLGGGHNISAGTKTLLQLGEFVEARGNRAHITQAGFTFLLQEVNAQVWSLLIVYLRKAPDLGMDAVEVLSFLFTLGSLDLGRAYSTTDLTPTQTQMLDDLSDFGIIYRSTPTAPRFYPTRLATTLTSDAPALPISSNLITGPANSSAGNSANPGKGYIIIETNYRLYAYTNSVLQISVLGLFTRFHTRFPNLVSGKLTKESVQRAISYGITADQIVSYLRAHAHPTMAKNDPVLPPTVVDQIRLWQIEGDRMKASLGFLVQGFTSQTEYEDTRNYADELGVLVWRNDRKRMFFVTQIQQIKVYVDGKTKARAEQKRVAA